MKHRVYGWTGNGPVTHMSTADKARQTVDLICRLKARIAALESENAALKSEVKKLREFWK